MINEVLGDSPGHTDDVIIYPESEEDDFIQIDNDHQVPSFSP